MKKYKLTLDEELTVEVEVGYDYPWYDESKGDMGDSDVEEVTEFGNFYEVGTPIEISKLEEILNNFKEKGFNHVFLDTNIDHQSYLFTPAKLEENERHKQM